LIDGSRDRGRTDLESKKEIEKMKAIHVERIGTTYRVSLTNGEEGVAETEVCAGRESLIVALGKAGASQKGIFDVFKRLESASNAKVCLQKD
jgi:hypothetical protein